MQAHLVFDSKGEFVQASNRKVNADAAAKACKGKVVEVKVDDKTGQGSCDFGTIAVEKGLWVFTPKGKKALTSDKD